MARSHSDDDCTAESLDRDGWTPFEGLSDTFRKGDDRSIQVVVGIGLNGQALLRPPPDPLITTHPVIGLSYRSSL